MGAEGRRLEEDWGARAASQPIEGCGTFPGLPQVADLLGWNGGYPDGVEKPSFEFEGIQREYLLYTPADSGGQQVPLWILAPGTSDMAETFLAISGIYEFAKEHDLSFVSLEGHECRLNVQLRSQAKEGDPDDVGYTLAVLREVSKKMSIDMDRIRCVGFSRGARFCSRLASELSSFISGATPVSGIRFPQPNNAIRPVPFLAFHGTGDPVNPFQGHGDPLYWEASVDTAVDDWVAFNGCTSQHVETLSSDVTIEKHTGCSQGADVWLATIQDGGHTWPGGAFDFKAFDHDFGKVGDIQALPLIAQFFEDTSMAGWCHTAVVGDRCYEAIEQARTSSEQYEGLTTDSGDSSIQMFLHEGFWADCPRPCEGNSSNVSTSSSLRGTKESLASDWLVSEAGVPYSLVADKESLESDWLGSEAGMPASARLAHPGAATAAGVVGSACAAAALAVCGVLWFWNRRGLRGVSLSNYLEPAGQE